MSLEPRRPSFASATDARLFSGNVNGAVARRTADGRRERTRRREEDSSESYVIDKS